MNADNGKQDLEMVIRAAAGLISAALRPEIDLPAFLNLVLDQTRALVPFEVGWLLLREGDRAVIRAADPRHRSDVGMSFPVVDCVSGLSMLRRAPINIPDLAQMPDEMRRVYKGSRVQGDEAMRSELVVPLLIGEEAMGALNIESPQLAAFGPQQVETLQLLGGHTALAIELARSRQEAAALGAIGSELARETELAALVRLVLEHALALIGAHFGQLLLLEGPELVVRYTTNVPARDLGLRVALDSSVSGLAVREGGPVIAPDVGSAAYFAVEFGAAARPALRPRRSDRPRYQRVLEHEKARMQAEFAVPFSVGGHVRGVLNLETPRPEGFSDEQRAGLLTFAHEHSSRFAAAAETGDETALRALLAAALAQADTSFGQLLELDGDELRIVQTTGGEPVGTRVRVSESVSGQAVLTNKAYYAPDVEQEPLYHRYLGEEMKSELAVPLLSGEQTLGVLNVESPVPAFFTSEHARILQALAGQAAIAIERARRTEIERLAAIGGLAGDIVHRLNNPLGALAGWVEMLKRKPFYPEMIEQYPYVAQFVARAERDLAHAKAIIQELRAELRRQTPEVVDVRAAIEEAVARAGLSEEDTISLMLDLPPGPLRTLAGPTLPGVLWNLIDNARNAMPNGGALTISARPAEPGWLALTVADTGVGVEPWRLPYIFDAAASTTPDAYAPTHGLGLWWAQSQVKSFGGTIAIESEVDKGTLVTLRLRHTKPLVEYGD